MTLQLVVMEWKTDVTSLFVLRIEFQSSKVWSCWTLSQSEFLLYEKSSVYMNCSSMIFERTLSWGITLQRWHIERKWMQTCNQEWQRVWDLRCYFDLFDTWIIRIFSPSIGQDICTQKRREKQVHYYKISWNLHLGGYIVSEFLYVIFINCRLFIWAWTLIDNQ